jgi:predicted dinucleotide-binding enzyme
MKNETDSKIIDAYSGMLEEAKGKASRKDCTISVTGRDRDAMRTIAKLLKEIQSIGNLGHSFEIILDSNYHDKNEKAKKFYWDGDGGAKIQSIQIDGKNF